MLAGSRIIETYGRVSVTLIKMGNPLIPFKYVGLLSRHGFDNNVATTSVRRRCNFIEGEERNIRIFSRMFPREQRFVTLGHFSLNFFAKISMISR